jgi:hypothetical protein
MCYWGIMCLLEATRGEPVGEWRLPDDRTYYSLPCAVTISKWSYPFTGSPPYYWKWNSLCVCDGVTIWPVLPCTMNLRGFGKEPSAVCSVRARRGRRPPDHADGAAERCQWDSEVRFGLTSRLISHCVTLSLESGPQYLQVSARYNVISSGRRTTAQ